MRKKRFMWIFFIVLLIAALIFFGFLPGYIDKSRNKVTAATERMDNADYNALPFIADLHCDALLWDRNLNKQYGHGHVDFPRMQAARLALQVFTVVSKTPKNMNIEQNDDQTDNITLLSIAQLRPYSTWFNITERALNQCRDLHRFAARSNGEMRVVTSQRELQQFIADRQTNPRLMAGMLGLEGAHCLNKDINNLQRFYEAGVRYIGLAHFFDNEWAGSAHGMKKGGLTEAGRELIRRMDSLRITIDLAHASPQTMDEVLAFTQSPLIVSHTGVQGVCNNRRNLSDAHLVEIGRRKGLVGIGLWETAVCGTDAAATAKSIRYVADKIGVDKVALGSDFDGAVATHFDVTGLPLILQALQKEGFTPTETGMIMGGNIRDFFLRQLPR